MYIVAAGSFTFGFTFNGPFPNSRAALDWGDSNLDRALSPWDIVELDSEGCEGCTGSWVLVIGDALNGNSVAGLFDSPESALEWEQNSEWDDSDTEGFSLLPAHLSPTE